jgi:hypothetical protein
LGQLTGALALLGGVGLCAGLDLFSHLCWSLVNCYMLFIFHKSVAYLIRFFTYLLRMERVNDCQIASLQSRGNPSI